VHGALAQRGFCVGLVHQDILLPRLSEDSNQHRTARIAGLSGFLSPRDGTKDSAETA
jgi:hypothetical protein